MSNDNNTEKPSKKLPIKLIFVIAILGTFVGLFLGTLGQKNHHNNGDILDKTLPEFKLADLYAPDTFITHEDIKNNAPALINIWASWCSPCRKEHKVITKLLEEHQLKIFGLNYKDSLEKGREFLDNHGNPYFKVANDTDGLTILKWGIRGVPETYIVNKEGKITYHHTGELRESDIEKILSEFKKSL